MKLHSALYCNLLYKKQKFLSYSLFKSFDINPLIKYFNTLESPPAPHKSVFFHNIVFLDESYEHNKF